MRVAESSRSTVLWLQHHVTKPRDDPRECIEVEPVVRLRPTMRKHKKRILLPFSVTSRKRRNAFKRDALFAVPVHHPNRPKRYLGQLDLALSRNASQRTPRCNRYVRRMRRIRDTKRKLLA